MDKNVEQEVLNYFYKSSVRAKPSLQQTAEVFNLTVQQVMKIVKENQSDN